MKISNELMRQWLITPGYIEENDFSECLAEAVERGLPVADILVDRNLIKDENLGQLISEKIGVPFFDLSKEKIDNSMLAQVEESMAAAGAFVIFGNKNGRCQIAFADPFDLNVISALENHLGHAVDIYYCTERMIRRSLGGYQVGTKEEIMKIARYLDEAKIDAAKRDNGVVKMVDLILRYGCQANASDIHIEPHISTIVVRFRIDGVMIAVLEFSKGSYEHLLSRIKILAKIRTDEHLAAQDGKFKFSFQESDIDDHVDVRVSIVPGTKGENIVMRLLSSRGRQYSLEDLGLSADDLKKVNAGLQSPHGMVLVTGPTGSGKTTTLYALIKILNSARVNIASIEDPVEYEIEGITQIQVNQKANLTFANGLRAIVRQDPNIIMIGEIRDAETADIAVNSAMTGHLVLSTLHTNDAVTTIPRLIEMDVEPFSIASSVKLIIAQRLVRKICEKCRISCSLAPEEILLLSQNAVISDFYRVHGHDDLAKLTLFKGMGCKACNNTGYKDRIGLFEILEINDHISEDIVKKASVETVLSDAKKSGMSTMINDGLEKTLSGMTTLSEVIRVIRD